MSNLSRRLSLGRLALLVALAVLPACKNEVAEAPAPIRPVKVVTAVRIAPTRAVTYSGSVKPRIEQVLSFRIAGKVVVRRVNIGDRIAPGDVLARLDTTDYLLSLKTAAANVEASKTRAQREGLEGVHDAFPERGSDSGVMGFIEDD